MTWPSILKIIEDEVGAQACAKIKNRVLAEFNGQRVTITNKTEVNFKDAERIAPGNPKEIARVLGVHPSTVYRAIKRGSLFVR